MKVLSLWLLLIGLALQVMATSKDLDVGLSKGQSVVLKIPRKLLLYEANSLATGLPIYFVNLRLPASPTSDRLAVGSHDDWNEEGWPLMTNLSFEKANRKKEYCEVELRSSVAYVKLRFDFPAERFRGSINDILFQGDLSGFEQCPYYRETVISRVLPRIFVGALGKMPVDKQLGLLRALNFNDDAIQYEQFKGLNYISFSAGRTQSVYNTLQVNQHDRTAIVLSDTILPSLKDAARYIADTSEIGGVKLTITALYKDFINDRNRTPYGESLEVYAPYNLIEKFFNLDITNQQLVDGSVILVNGNRMQISLTNSR